MPITIGVHDPECTLQIVLVLENLAINSGRHEFLEVYDSISIIVALINDLVPVDVVVVHDLLMDHLFQFPLR